MRKYIAIIIASLALFTGQAHAQRCLPKMQGIEVRADMADGFNLGGKDGGYSFGAALSTYTKKGNKWVFGGEYLLKNNPYKDTKIPVAQFTAEGGCAGVGVHDAARQFDQLADVAHQHHLFEVGCRRHIHRIPDEVRGLDHRDIL